MSGRTDLRSLVKVVFVSQAETVSGRNTGVVFTEAAGVATGTSAQAHNYIKGDRIFLSGATGGNAVIYNDAQGWIIQTVPSATTFTIAVPSGTGNSAGTVVADKPMDVVGMQLAAVQIPAAITSATLSFTGDLEGNNTFGAVTDLGGASIAFTIAASKLLVATGSAASIAGIAKLRVVMASAEGAVRRLVVSFILTNE